MKATLEFNLPEEDQEHQDALYGSRWRSVVFELDQRLRSRDKHGGDKPVRPSEIRNWIRDLLVDGMTL